MQQINHLATTVGQALMVRGAAGEGFTEEVTSDLGLGGVSRSWPETQSLQLRKPGVCPGTLCPVGALGQSREGQQRPDHRRCKGQAKGFGLCVSGGLGRGGASSREEMQPNVFQEDGHTPVTSLEKNSGSVRVAGWWWLTVTCQVHVAHPCGSPNPLPTLPPSHTHPRGCPGPVSPSLN